MSKFLKKLLKWEVPGSLPMRCLTSTEEFCWEDWHEQMKSKYPIKYFICESVPSFFRHYVYLVGEFWYWLRCHTYKKYHLLDLRQPKNSPMEYRWGWCDVRQQMVYAYFNLLKGYIEKELGGIDDAKRWLIHLQSGDESELYVANEYQIKVIKTAIEIYDWWENGRLIELKKIDDLHEEWGKGNKDADSNKILTTIIESEEKFENNINEKLHQMIEIRLGLWT